MAKKVVILGGGVGGVASAKLIAEEAKRRDVDVEVTLVTDSDKHFMPPLFADVALGEVSPDDAYVSIAGLSKYFGVNVVIDPVVSIDAANRRVSLKSGKSIDYDYLVVALGVKYDWGKYPGLSTEGFHNYTLDGAIELRKALSAFKGGNVVILVPETPYRCGIYPFEMATMLGAYFKNTGIKASVTVLSADAKPVTPLGKDIHRMWFEAFEEYGVNFVVHKGLQEVDAVNKVVRASNVEEKYDLLIKVPPVGLPDPLAASEGFRLESDPRFAPVKAPTFQHPKYDDVYMVGEHSMAPAGLSLAGVFVHDASLVASNHLLADIIGFYPRYRIPTATCAGYVGDKGFMGHCEIRFNPETGKYEWGSRCFLGPVGPLVRLFKLGFYKSWLSSLR